MRPRSGPLGRAGRDGRARQPPGGAMEPPLARGLLKATPGRGDAQVAGATVVVATSSVPGATLQRQHCGRASREVNGPRCSPLASRASLAPVELVDMFPGTAVRRDADGAVPLQRVGLRPPHGPSLVVVRFGSCRRGRSPRGVLVASWLGGMVWKENGWSWSCLYIKRRFLI